MADVARSAERAINQVGLKKKSRLGWVPTATGYIGYGDPSKVRVLGRVLMAPPGEGERGEGASRSIAVQAQRGFRQFFTTQVPDHPVTIRAGQRQVETRTDGNGYVDMLIDDHGLQPGWQTVSIQAEGSKPAAAEVQILAPGTEVGLVSDVDDTVIVTMLPRAMIAAYNSWVLRTNARKAVPGMAEFYAALQRRHPDMPVFYLSTGAWNTFDTLVEFLRKHGFPRGPLLLTDWGPTPTGLFRSGQEHKKVQLRNLVIDFPSIKWLLVGDDGQHDPLIYGNFAAEHPARVAGIAIRELTPGEHVLAHGTVAPIVAADAAVVSQGEIPYIMGEDGFELLKEFEKSPFL